MYESLKKKQLNSAFKIAEEDLKQSPNKMKFKYDINTKRIQFKPGDKLFAFLIIPRNPLKGKYFTFYLIGQKLII